MKRIMPGIYALASILASTAVLAEEEGHAEPMTFMGDWLPRLVNFAIIAGVIVYFMRKPVRDFFKNRSAEIAKAIQESKDARERAVAALAEMERKIKDFEAEAGKMVDEARSRGEKDRQALIEEAKKVVADVDTQVKQGIEVELQKAKTVLAVEAAILSVDLAEGKIKEKINSQDHERIVREYIAKVGGKS
jgi:F-type H+-transporting ATPase subunit b